MRTRFKLWAAQCTYAAFGCLMYPCLNSCVNATHVRGPVKPLAMAFWNIKAFFLNQMYNFIGYCASGWVGYLQESQKRLVDFHSHCSPLAISLYGYTAKNLTYLIHFRYILSHMITEKNGAALISLIISFWTDSKSIPINPFWISGLRYFTEPSGQLSSSFSSGSYMASRSMMERKWPLLTLSLFSKCPRNARLFDAGVKVTLMMRSSCLQKLTCSQICCSDTLSIVPCRRHWS